MLRAMQPRDAEGPNAGAERFELILLSMANWRRDFLSAHLDEVALLGRISNGLYKLCSIKRVDSHDVTVLMLIHLAHRRLLAAWRDLEVGDTFAAAPHARMLVELANQLTFVADDVRTADLWVRQSQDAFRRKLNAACKPRWSRLLAEHRSPLKRAWKLFSKLAHGNFTAAAGGATTARTGAYSLEYVDPPALTVDVARWLLRLGLVFLIEACRALHDRGLIDDPAESIVAMKQEIARLESLPKML